MNGYASVREDTRQKVLEYARQIGYTQSVRSTESNARLTRIGIVANGTVDNPDGISPYQGILTNLLDELGQSHYDTVLISPSIFT